MTLARSDAATRHIRPQPGVKASGRGRPKRAAAGVAAAALLLTGAGFAWAATVLLTPPAPLPPNTTSTLVAAEMDSVARTIGLNARATWGGGTTVANTASGTVTRVRVGASRTVRAGDAVYDVNLVPVRVAQGSVPAFRTLARGTRGTDVRQLQQLLRAAGVRDRAPDGVFGPATSREVSRWQRTLGQPPTGEVALGELLFLPRLPAPITLQGLNVGTVVAPGGSAVAASGEGGDAPGVVGLRILPPAPTFSISLPDNQAGLVRSGMGVQLQRGETTWRATVASVGAPDADGTAVAALAAPDGARNICGNECGQVPPAGDAGIQALIELVPRTPGVVLPSTALVVDSAGRSAVVREDGTRVPVNVRASAGGRIVVDGITAGEKVQVPGDNQP